MAQTDQLMGINGTLDFSLELRGGKMFLFVPWVVLVWVRWFGILRIPLTIPFVRGSNRNPNNPKQKLSISWIDEIQKKQKNNSTTAHFAVYWLIRSESGITSLLKAITVTWGRIEPTIPQYIPNNKGVFHCSVCWCVCVCISPWKFNEWNLKIMISKN